MDANAAISQVLEIASRIVSACFILLMAATVLRYFGFRIPSYANPPAATEFAYAAGAWWLIRKAG